jgi:hypothetical protein
MATIPLHPIVTETATILLICFAAALGIGEYYKNHLTPAKMKTAQIEQSVQIKEFNIGPKL